MWKNLSIIAICMSLAPSSFAQKKVSLDVNCYKPEEVIKVIDEHKEEYVFAGIENMHKVKNMTMVLFLNKATGTYSLVFHANDQGVVCAVSSGTNGILLK